MNTMQVFSNNLAKLLKRKGNLSELARFCKVSQPSVSYWVNCKKFPSPENLDLIAAYFSIEVSDLFVENPLPIKERELLSKFQRLNDKGKDSALGMLDVLLSNADFAEESA